VRREVKVVERKLRGILQNSTMYGQGRLDCNKQIPLEKQFLSKEHR